MVELQAKVEHRDPGFRLIGFDEAPFTGILQGNAKMISNLYINGEAGSMFGR